MTEDPAVAGSREAFGLSFSGAAGYLDTASIGIPPEPAASALLDAVRDWQAARTRPADYDSAVDSARRAFAGLCGVAAPRIAIGGSASALVGLVASAVPDGTRVLTAEREFTSVTFPFAVQCGRGVSVDEVPVAQIPDRAGDYDIVAAAVVQSRDGTVLDLEALRAATHGSRTRVLLDVTQAAGWLPLALDWADAVVCAGYKWLLSPRGAAWLAVGDDLAAELTPTAANWYAGEARWDSAYGLPPRLARDARRLDTSPAWFSHVGAAAALAELATLDLAAVHAHCTRLADAFRAELGLAPAGSAIVSVEAPDGPERLERSGLRGSIRDGRVRLSFHLYSDDNDLDRAVSAFSPPRRP